MITFNIVGMDSVNSTNSRGFFDAGKILNVLTSFTPFPTFFRPTVVFRSFVVKKSLGERVCRAKLKELCEGCRWRLLCPSLSIFGCKVDSLAVFEVNSQLLDCGMVGMYWKGENSPQRFVGRNMSSCLEAFYFVVGVLVPYSEYRHVLTFVNVFQYVLDAKNRTAYFNVNVTAECSEEKGIVGYYPTVVNWHAAV